MWAKLAVVLVFVIWVYPVEVFAAGPTKQPTDEIVWKASDYGAVYQGSPTKQQMRDLVSQHPMKHYYLIGASYTHQGSSALIYNVYAFDGEWLDQAMVASSTIYWDLNDGGLAYNAFKPSSMSSGRIWIAGPVGSTINSYWASKITSFDWEEPTPTPVPTVSPAPTVSPVPSADPAAKDHQTIQINFMSIILFLGSLLTSYIMVRR